MKQAWVLRIELNRFFEKQKSKARKMTDKDLSDVQNVPIMRVRVKAGPLKDRILFAVYENLIRDEYDPREVQLMLKEGLLEREQINVNGTLRTVFCYTEKECEYQPSFHKRLFTKAVRWLENRGFFNRE